VPRGELDPEEEAAGEIIAKLLGGTAVPRDVPGADEKTHDIDIEMPDGRRISLEVTSIADGEREALARLALHTEHKAPTLSQDWWVGLPMDGKLKVKPLMKDLIPLLKTFEAHDVNGVDRFPRGGSAGHDGEVAQAIRSLHELGALHAHALGPPKPGEVAQILTSLAGGSTSNFGLLNDSVAKCAQRKVEKLIAAGGDERHLFVWLHGSASDAHLAMTTLPPPDSVPYIPEGIDVAWLAVGVPGQSVSWLWQLRPPGGWEKIASGQDD
jgi:hypothetical protein